MSSYGDAMVTRETGAPNLRPAQRTLRAAKKGVPQRPRLTDAMIENIKPPRTGQRLIWDSEPGFVLRVAASGRKFFLLDYYTNSGRRGRMSIGEWTNPHFLIADARLEAAKKKADIGKGGDPVREKRSARLARQREPTLADLRDEWLHHAATRAKPKGAASLAGDRAMFAKWILPVLDEKTKVAAVTRRDVKSLRSKMVLAGSPIAGNRMLSLLSAAMTHVMDPDFGWITANPVKGIDRKDEQRRERYLTTEELARLDAELNRTRQPSADIVRLLVLTGARRGEVLKARWEEFIDLDGDRPAWVKPSSHTKQKKLHRIPLNPPVVEVLRRMHECRRNDSAYLFPNLDDLGRPATDLKNFWKGVCKRARLADLRIHDLRHAFASFLINRGVPLEAIGQLLGHTRAETTRRYTHLVDETLREATGRMIDVMPSNEGRVA